MDDMHPDHLEDLQRSGLTEKTIKEARIASISPDRINKKIGFNIPGLISAYEIPYDNEYSRFKVFYEAGKEVYSDGKTKPKYLARKESGNRLYVPDTAKKVFQDVTVPLYITEGEKKALKGCQQGLPCIALSGLWCWKIKGEENLISDFDQIVLENRKIYIVPDNDWQNPNRKGERKNLIEAVNKLCYQLIERNAKVYIVELPSGNLKGLDDFLCRHSVEEFRDLPFKKIRNQTIEEMVSEATPDTAPDVIKKIIKKIAKQKSEIEKAQHINKLAKIIGVSKRSISSEIQKLIKKNELTKKEIEQEQKDYFIKNDSYYYTKVTKYDHYDEQVSNFVIDIIREIEISDGYEKKRIFEGKIKGSGFCRDFVLDAKSYFNNNKLQEAIGDQAGTMAQFKPEDIKHIRLASLQLSNVKHESVLMQFGWTDDDIYLTPSVVITKDGIKENTEIKVDLSTAENARHLDMQILTDEKFVKVARHIIDDLLMLQPIAITYPLIGHTFAPPVMRFLKDKTKPAKWERGITGCGKSYTAGLVQCFYGDFTKEGSIVSWASTTNFIQTVGFHFKDALYLVDDFKQSNIKDKNNVIKLLQSHADGTGRGRLKIDSSTKQTRPIRGLMLVTGEDTPGFEASILARMLISECKNKEKDLLRGERCTHYRKYYSGVMARFIHWFLRKNLKDEISATVQNHTKTFYKGIEGKQNDSRIAHNLALNFTGFFLFCSFMEDSGIITESDTSRMLDDITKIIYSIRDRQIQTVQNEQASNIFINTLSDLIANNRVFINSHYKDANPKDLRNMVGFIKEGADQYVYITPVIAFAEVQKVIAQGGGNLNFTKDAIGRQLLDDGFLLLYEKGRTTKNVKFESHAHRVWVFKKSDLGLLKAERGVSNFYIESNEDEKESENSQSKEAIEMLI